MEGLRRRCERRLRGIRIPNPFDLDAFCAEVEARRGRPLLRRPVPGLSSGAPCGLWIGTEQADHVFFDPGTSPLHAEHIVLHEVAHILMGHAPSRPGVGRLTPSEPEPGGGDSALARLLPDLDPATVTRVLSEPAAENRMQPRVMSQPAAENSMQPRVMGRVSYTTAQEREAEMMASLIRGRFGRPPRTTLGRVADAFGFAEETRRAR